MAPNRSELPRPRQAPKTAEFLAQNLRAHIVETRLAEGDHLPTELEMMKNLKVGRAAVREALRILEAEQLIEVRRGSRLGPRVRLPGPEIVSRPVELLLHLSGATLADVHRARLGVEPLAAGLLAVHGSQDDFDELDVIVAEDFPQAWQTDDLGVSTARFHLRIVELSANAVLIMLAHVIHDVIRAHPPHPAAAHRLPRVHFEGLTASCRRFIELLRARDGDAAEAHWRQHLEFTITSCFDELEAIVVGDGSTHSTSGQPAIAHTRALHLLRRTSDI